MLAQSEINALRHAADVALAYRQDVSGLPIGPSESYERSLRSFGGPMPENGTPAETVINELVAHVQPSMMGYIHPRFLGWVTGASHPAGVAADWLTSAWGQNGAGGDSAVAAASAEEVAGNWVKELLGLPESCAFGLTSGATMANTTGLAAARHALLARQGWDVEADGLFGAPEITVVAGAEMHSTMGNALRLIGFGAKRLLEVEIDENGRMQAEALARVLAPLDGPILVIAQAGHINSGAIDPLDEICAIAHAKQAWVHVDGAFGLWARACPSRAHLAVGAEACDSWAVDGHKWLQTPYDGAFVFVKDGSALKNAMTIQASYLLDGDVRNPRDYSPELSRRARGFAIWAVLRALGRKGIAEMVALHCDMAKSVATALADVQGLKVLNDVSLNQLVLCCDTGKNDDALTRELLARLQAQNVCYPSGATWKNRAIIRMSFCSGNADAQDAALIIDEVKSTWQAMGKFDE